LGGHAAFGYLARRYNLNQIALYGLSPDSKPTPRKLAEVVNLAEEHQIKVIYFEDYVSDELAKVIAKEVGAKILVLNAGANISQEQLKSGTTFLEIMEKNLEILKHGLCCR
jgi:zinc transport system substrate-binding protein